MSKSLLGLFIAIAFMLLAALPGCFQHTDNAGPKKKASLKSEGGMLVFGRQADVNKMDPHFITDIPSSQYLLGKIYEGLVGKDKDMNLQPMLATSWKRLDATVWKFTLRQGVFFHDGAPFNAQAVKVTFDRLMDPRTNSPHATYYNFIKEVEVIDDYTVHFVLRFPFASLPEALTSYKAVILSPQEVARSGSRESKNPVGTGPFTFKSWEPGRELRIIKNMNYWGPLPKIDGVIFKIVTDADARLALIEKGELHVAQPLTVNFIQRVQASSDMKIYRKDSVSIQYLGFNTKNKPFDDVQIRQAISYAIEKEAIIKGIYQNAGKKAISPVPPKTFAYNPDVKQYEYNLNKAKALVTAAGYPDGFKTTLWCRDSQVEMDLAKVIQSQLKGIGIDVKIISLENRTYRDAIQAGRHEMFLEQAVDETGDADYNQFRKFSSKSFGAAGNRFFYHNTELDALIDAGRKEYDPQKRMELYAEAQRIEMSEAVCVPICIPEILVVTGKDVLGFEMDATFNPIFTNVVVK